MKLKTILLKTFAGVLLYFFIMGPYSFFVLETITPEDLFKIPIILLFELKLYPWLLLLVSEIFVWIFTNIDE